ncbi:TadE family type IV pilus minor pilin [Microbacterium luticocti]|uniref:TadE family type IV pilus minor pilin n=1 Tax=Microbacterium luticocti TaxID=451764 RepID=UPI0003F5E35F|nr:TadE family type IV pilus minor pilin [Microbacterium luticocti]
MIFGRDDRGSVTAEFAVALPAVVLVLALGAGVLGACGRAVRLQDATADAARLVARGEPAARAQALVAAAVGGARTRVTPRGELVCVEASAPATAPGGVPLPAPALRASSCALAGGK